MSKKQKSKKCSTPYCRNDRGKGRTICYKCLKRQQRERHPMKAAFYDLRTNAKRRGKSFELTFEEFEKFCEETGYMDKKGKTAESMSIDRIRNEEGYTYNNIRVLSLSDNSKKEFDPELEEVFGKPTDEVPF